MKHSIAINLKEGQFTEELFVLPVGIKEFLRKSTEKTPMLLFLHKINSKAVSASFFYYSSFSKITGLVLPCSTREAGQR